MHAAVLRYLEEVTHCGSIRQAAERLHVTASAVNRQILKVESEFGIQFFERLPRGVRLTPAGEVILRHVRTTLRDFESVRGEIGEMRGYMSGTVRIACLDSLAVHFLPKIIAASTSLHPGIGFAVETRVHRRIIKILADGDADIGITFDFERHPRLLPVATIAMPIMAIVGPSHPLADCSEVTIQECVAYRLLLQHDTEPIRKLIESELLQFEQLKRPFTSCNNFNLFKPLIERGIGIGFFTAMGFVQEIHDGLVRAVPVSASSFNRLRLAVLVDRGRPISVATASVIELLKAEIIDLEKTAQPAVHSYPR